MLPPLSVGFFPAALTQEAECMGDTALGQQSVPACHWHQKCPAFLLTGKRKDQNCHVWTVGERCGMAQRVGAAASKNTSMPTWCWTMLAAERYYSHWGSQTGTVD